MPQTQFFKILIKQHSLGSKYQLKTILNIFSFMIILIEEITIFELQTQNSNLISKNGFFPLMPIFGVIFSCMYLTLIGIGFLLNKIQQKQKSDAFWKNTMSRISLIISLLQQIIYIPSIATTLNFIKKQIQSPSKAQITSAILFTILILLSQLIISLLQNIHIFSVKTKSFGKSSLSNPLLICSIHNFVFPFLCQEEWLLLAIDMLAFVIIGWEIFCYPRLCEQYDKWSKIYLSGFFGVQIFMVAQNFQQNSAFSAILPFFSLVLAIVIYLLIQKRYLYSIQNSRKSEKQLYLMKEIYYNLISKNHKNITLILLSHKKNCPDSTNCHCSNVFFNSQCLSEATQRQLVPFSNQINENVLNIVINFQENLFAQKANNQSSKIKMEFKEKSSDLLFYIYILILEHKKYTKAFLLLKEYQERWKGLSFLFEIQIEILLEEITELKNIHSSTINQKSTLYSDYWTFHEKYETFVRYIEQVLPLLEQIWIQMLSLQPDEQEVLSSLKRFNSLDNKISSTFESLLKTSPEHIRHINSVMGRYEKAALNIFNERLSVLKNANLLLEKKSSQLKENNQILDKEGRIFAKSLNNIVFVLNVSNIGQESSSNNIRQKNKIFKEIFEKNTQINSLSQLLLPEIAQNHNKLIWQFLLTENPFLDHSNTIALIQVKEDLKEIQAYQMWCQIVILKNQICISVILNNEKISKDHGVFVQNEKEEILYNSANLKDFISKKNDFSTFRSPEEENFISSKETESFYFQEVSLYTEEIAKLKDGNLKVYRVKLPSSEEVDQIQPDTMTVGYQKKSELTINSFMDRKSSMIEDLMTKIQHADHNEKIIKLEKFYKEIHAPMNKNFTLRLAIFFIMITLVFIGFWILCYMANIKKSQTISFLSSKVNAISVLINSLCSANTALKLLIIKSHFEKGFNEFQIGIDIINRCKKQVLDNIAEILNDPSTLSIYHLNLDGSSFFTNETMINSVMNGFLKQITFVTAQPFQSLKLSPVLSENLRPLTHVSENFFQANFNLVNEILTKLFSGRANFFENNIAQRLDDFSSNRGLAFASAGALLMMVFCGLIIVYRKKEQMISNESLRIFEKISLQHKSYRLNRVKEFKQSYISYHLPKVCPNDITKTIVDMKLNEKSDNIEINSFNFFDGIFSQQNTSSTANVQDKVKQESFVPFFTKMAEIGRTEIFKNENFQGSYLKKTLFFLPFFIYFMYIIVSNILFNLEMKKALDFQNSLTWQKQLISISRQYSIQLGMYELPLDLGTSNVDKVDKIYSVIHEIKKEYEIMDTDSEFSKIRYFLDNLNICQNLHLLQESQTLGVEITRQKCKDKRFGLSLQKGFHQSLVYYLDTVRDFSLTNVNPFNFTLEKRHEILQSKKLQIIVHLGEYLNQIHQIEYDAYRSDINNRIKIFNKTNDIIGSLVIVIWLGLIFFLWRFIVKKKIQQISLIKAAFKLTSFSLLSKSDSEIQKVTNHKISSYFE